MFIVNQFSLSVNLADVAATNDNNPATGIGAGGPYNGAITAVSDVGVPTPIVAGVGVMPLVTTKATWIPFAVVSNYYDISLLNAVAVLNQPHVMALTHYNLHISPYEYVLDYKLTSLESNTGPTANNILPAPAPVVNYNRANQTFFITIPNAAIANYTNGNNLILQVVFGRQN